jgi:hypothetical protein
MNRSIKVVADELFAPFGLEPIPVPEYVYLQPARVNPRYLTEQELRWMAEAQHTGENE